MDINIISSNSIHNNIVIINSIPNKKGENIINLNQSFFLNKTPLKISMKGNIKRKKEFEPFYADNDKLISTKMKMNMTIKNIIIIIKIKTIK